MEWLGYDPAAVVIRAGRDTVLLGQLREVGRTLVDVLKETGNSKSNINNDNDKDEEKPVLQGEESGCGVDAKEEEEEGTTTTATDGDPKKLLDDFDLAAILAIVGGGEGDPEIINQLRDFASKLSRYGGMANKALEGEQDIDGREGRKHPNKELVTVKEGGVNANPDEEEGTVQPRKKHKGHHPNPSSADHTVPPSPHGGGDVVPYWQKKYLDLGKQTAKQLMDNQTELRLAQSTLAVFKQENLILRKQMADARELQQQQQQSNGADRDLSKDPARPQSRSPLESGGRKRNRRETKTETACPPKNQIQKSHAFDIETTTTNNSVASGDREDSVPTTAAPLAPSDPSEQHGQQSRSINSVACGGRGGIMPTTTTAVAASDASEQQGQQSRLSSLSVASGGRGDIMPEKPSNVAATYPSEQQGQHGGWPVNSVANHGRGNCVPTRAVNVTTAYPSEQQGQQRRWPNTSVAIMPERPVNMTTIYPSEQQGQQSRWSINPVARGGRADIPAVPAISSTTQHYRVYDAATNRRGSSSDATHAIGARKVVQYQANFSFQGDSGLGQLCFSAGDVINVDGSAPLTRGWVLGTLSKDGRRGWCPQSYIAILHSPKSSAIALARITGNQQDAPGQLPASTIDQYNAPVKLQEPPDTHQPFLNASQVVAAPTVGWSNALAKLSDPGATMSQHSIISSQFPPPHTLGWRNAPEETMPQHSASPITAAQTAKHWEAPSVFFQPREMELHESPSPALDSTPQTTDQHDSQHGVTHPTPTDLQHLKSDLFPAARTTDQPDKPRKLPPPEDEETVLKRRSEPAEASSYSLTANPKEYVARGEFMADPIAGQNEGGTKARATSQKEDAERRYPRPAAPPVGQGHGALGTARKSGRPQRDSKQRATRTASLDEYQATHDFEGDSKSKFRQLSFSKDDIINLEPGAPKTGGWVLGTLARSGRSGWCPESYITILYRPTPPAPSTDKTSKQDEDTSKDPLPKATSQQQSRESSPKRATAPTADQGEPLAKSLKVEETNHQESPQSSPGAAARPTNHDEAAQEETTVSSPSDSMLLSNQRAVPSRFLHLKETNLQRSVGLLFSELSGHRVALGLEGRFKNSAQIVQVNTAAGMRVSHLKLDGGWCDLPYNRDDHLRLWILKASRYPDFPSYDITLFAQNPDRPAVPIFWKHKQNPSETYRRDSSSRPPPYYYYIGHYRCFHFQTFDKEIRFKAKRCEASLELEFVHFDDALADVMRAIKEKVVNPKYRYDYRY